MSMIRYWSPFDDIRRLENEVSNLFRSYQTKEDDGYYTLPISIEENDDGYIVRANLPGFTKEDIDLEATSQYLEIKANKKMEEKKQERNYIINELSRVNFHRRISFDKPVDATNAKTILRNGVIEITMPKSEAAKSVKLIPEEAD